MDADDKTLTPTWYTCHMFRNRYRALLRITLFCVGAAFCFPFFTTSAETPSDLIRARAVPVTKTELEAIPIDIPQLPLESDADADGLADVFEQALGSSPASDDTDSDGLTDFFELLAGTDPLGPGRFTIDSATATKFRGAFIVHHQTFWYVDPQKRLRIWLPLDFPDLVNALLEPSARPSPPAPQPPAPPKPLPQPQKPPSPKPAPQPIPPPSPKPSPKPVPKPTPKPKPIPKPVPKPAPKSQQQPKPTPTTPVSPAPTRTPKPPVASPTNIQPTEPLGLTPILTPERLPPPKLTLPSPPTDTIAVTAENWKRAAEALPMLGYEKSLLPNGGLSVTSDGGLYRVEVPNLGSNAESFARFQLRKLKLDAEVTRRYFGDPYASPVLLQRFVIDPQAKAVGSCCGKASEHYSLTWYYQSEQAFLEAADLGRTEHAWILERFWNVPSGNHELVHRFVRGTQLSTLIDEGIANYLPSRIVNLGPGVECRQDGYVNGNGRLTPYQTVKEGETDRLYPSAECLWWLLDQRFGEAAVKSMLERLRLLPSHDTFPPLTDEQIAQKLLATVIIPVVGEDARALLSAFQIPR